MISSNALGLIGSAGKAARTSSGRLDAEDRGSNAAAQSKAAHSAMAQQALFQGLQLVTQAAKNSAQAAIYEQQASKLREDAAHLHPDVSKQELTRIGPYTDESRGPENRPPP